MKTQVIRIYSVLRSVLKSPGAAPMKTVDQSEEDNSNKFEVPKEQLEQVWGVVADTVSAKGKGCNINVIVTADRGKAKFCDWRSLGSVFETAAGSRYGTIDNQHAAYIIAQTVGQRIVPGTAPLDAESIRDNPSFPYGKIPWEVGKYLPETMRAWEDGNVSVLVRPPRDWTDIMEASDRYGASIATPADIRKVGTVSYPELRIGKENSTASGVTLIYNDLPSDSYYDANDAALLERWEKRAATILRIDFSLVAPEDAKPDTAAERLQVSIKPLRPNPPGNF